MRGPSGRGVSRLARAGVLDPYIEHGKPAQRSHDGLVACFPRQRLCQAGNGIQGRSSRIMALSATSSLRATAISATCFGLPTASRRARKAASWGSQRTAARAARYNALRTRGRPPAILRRARNCPLSRASGARPTKAAACLPLSCPNSGRSATKAQEVFGPMPGSLAGGRLFAQCSLHLLLQQRDLLAQRSDHPLHARHSRSALQLLLAGTLPGS